MVADILVANPAVRADSVRQLIDLAKAEPGSLVYASAGNGTLNHLAPEMLKAAAGIDMVHVPYQGAIAAMNDVMAVRSSEERRVGKECGRTGRSRWRP